MIANASLLILKLCVMSSQDRVLLRETWEQTTKSLSKLLTSCQHKEGSRVALSAFDAQRQRLQLWADTIGLTNDDVDDHLNLPKMREILQQIDENINSVIEFNGPQSPKIWLSSTSLEAFTEKLNQSQERLQPFLSESQRARVRATTRELALGLLCADAPSELEDMEAACKIFGGKSTEGSQELLRLIQSRRRFIDLPMADQPAPSNQISQRSRAYLKDSNNLTNLWDERTERTIGFWAGMHTGHVYVEWKTITDEESLDRREVLQERIQDWANVLSSDAGLKVLQLLAIIQRPLQSTGDQWGFVYELPKSVRIDLKTQLMPSTLRDLLEHRDTFTPSLSTRMDLARQLASSLLNFHSIGWLHKNVRSENVMFFPKDLSQRSLKRPRWVGLTYARGDTEIDEKVSERTAW